MKSPPRQLLLVEPNSLWRRTLAAVVRELAIAEVEECLRVEQARQRLQQRGGYDALVLSLDDDPEGALELLERLRDDPRPRLARVPVIVLGERCDNQLAMRLHALQVHRMLIKPFKLRQALLAVAAVWPGLVPEAELQER
jgi:CheY-like chemotaxis protein